MISAQKLHLTLVLKDYGSQFPWKGFVGSVIWMSKSVIGYTNCISTVNWANTGVTYLSITGYLKSSLMLRIQESVRIGMIWLLLSSGMSLVEDCSWKSYSLEENQRGNRTWGQAGPSPQKKSWLWVYTRTSPPVKLPFQTSTDRVQIGRNCFPGLFSSPALEERTNGKGIGTLPVGPKHCRQNFQFN